MLTVVGVPGKVVNLSFLMVGGGSGVGFFSTLLGGGGVGFFSFLLEGGVLSASLALDDDISSMSSSNC